MIGLQQARNGEEEEVEEEEEEENKKDQKATVRLVPNGSDKDIKVQGHYLINLFLVQEKLD